MGVFSPHQGVYEDKVSLSLGLHLTHVTWKVKKSKMTRCDVLVLAWPFKPTPSIQAKIAKQAA